VQAEQLRVAAERLGVTSEDLARAAIVDLLASPRDRFSAAAERVLKKERGTVPATGVMRSVAACVDPRRDQIAILSAI
jgi:hypothetical protein